MNQFLKYLSITYLLLFVFIVDLNCQSNIEAEFCFNRISKFLIIGFDNPIEFCVSDNIEIHKEDIVVQFTHYKSKISRQLKILENDLGYYVRPDSLGFIKLEIDLPNGNKKSIDLKTKFLTAKVRYLNYSSTHDKPLDAEEFKSGKGIEAIAEFSGNCTVSSYEVIRIDSLDNAVKFINIGAKFNERSKKLVEKASTGDIYIFRKIYYKCSGTYLPLILDNMILEIK